MFSVKKNQLFESRESGNVIRVLNTSPSSVHSGVVTVGNVDSRNRTIKSTVRDVRVDSIRRRYYSFY